MPQISSAKEAFALMQDGFDASKAEGVDGTVLLDLTGDGGGKWAIRIAGGAFEVIEGGVESPTTTLTMSAEDFVGISIKQRRHGHPRKKVSAFENTPSTQGYNTFWVPAMPG